jgi:hypothetical protein
MVNETSPEKVLSLNLSRPDFSDRRYELLIRLLWGSRGSLSFLLNQPKSNQLTNQPQSYQLTTILPTYQLAPNQIPTYQPTYQLTNFNYQLYQLLGLTLLTYQPTNLPTNQLTKSKFNLPQLNLHKSN